ncbi:uncharacterized protein J5F26_010186 [Ciconia maguari]
MGSAPTQERKAAWEPAVQPGVNCCRSGSPADGALLPRGGAAVPALLAGARRSPPGRPGRRRAGRAGAGAGPGGGARGSAEARFCPRERFAARCRFWRRLKPAPPPARELRVSPKGSQTRSPKKQRKGRKLGSRRSPRPGGKSSSPHKVGRSVTPRPPATSCLPAPRSRAARGSSPAGRPPTDRTGPRPPLRSPPPSRRQVPACLHRGGGSGSRGRAGCCPAGPAPARATSALSGRRQGTPRGRRLLLLRAKAAGDVKLSGAERRSRGAGGSRGPGDPGSRSRSTSPRGRCHRPLHGSPDGAAGSAAGPRGPLRAPTGMRTRGQGCGRGPGKPPRSGAAPGPARESVTPAQRPVRAAAHPRSVSKKCLRQPRRALRGERRQRPPRRSAQIGWNMVFWKRVLGQLKGKSDFSGGFACQLQDLCPCQPVAPFKQIPPVFPNKWLCNVARIFPPPLGVVFERRISARVSRIRWHNEG